VLTRQPWSQGMASYYIFPYLLENIAAEQESGTMLL